jgi:hypothetical protein
MALWRVREQRPPAFFHFSIIPRSSASNRSRCLSRYSIGSPIGQLRCVSVTSPLGARWLRSERFRKSFDKTPSFVLMK